MTTDDFGASTSDLAESLGVPEDAVLAATGFVTLVGGCSGDPEAGDRFAETFSLYGPDLFLDLADPAVVTAVFDRVLEFQAFDTESIGRAADWLIEHGPRQVAAAAHWIAGAAASSGHIEDAEGHYLRSLAADSDFGPALLYLAQYESDRGNAERALDLYGRLEDGREHPMYQLLSGYRENRDYSLAERARWLYAKIGQFVELSHWRIRAVELALVRASHLPGGHENPSLGLDDFVWDVALFETGAFAEFLRTRGKLLPDDEQLLAQQWLRVGRSLFEVDAVRPGSGITMRDLRTGDRIDVTERTASRQVKAGELYCTRIVPVGDGLWNIFGGAEAVTLPQRGPLMALLDDAEADPEELVSFLSARFAPPRLVTAGGDEMVFCTAEFSVPSSATLRRKLSRRFGAARGDEWAWTDGERVLGVVRLDRTGEPWTLTVEAMSEFDFDDMIELVVAAAPNAREITESRTPAAEMLAQAQQSASEVPGDLDDEELAAILDERIREYEQAWLDEQIPALDGLTPRQAAADPTRRDDLIHLLGTLPAEERPGVMSARRLREALGL